MSEYRGVSTYGVLPGKTSPPAPAPGSNGLLVYHWPSQKRLTPRRCQHCRATLIANDVPTAEHPTVRVSCLLCSREACELVADGWAPRRMTAEEFRALPVRQGRREQP